jgi:tight adherence protein B
MVCRRVNSLFFFIFFLVTLVFGIIGTIIYNRKQAFQKRVKHLLTTNLRAAEDPQEKNEKNYQKHDNKWKYILEFFAKNIKTRQGQKEKWTKSLESADIPLKPEEFVVIRLLLLILLAFVSVIIFSQFFIVLLFAALGWYVPISYIKIKRDKRIAACAEQLPQVLETMATSLRSGFSFMQSMQLISKEMPEPIGPEFYRTIREINLGISLEEAFENLLKRMPNKDLEIMITAVLIQRSTGGNLAQILEMIQDTIVERVRMKDELRSLTAQGKMSAWVISLLPVILGFSLNMMNPEYFSPMLTHPLGWFLLSMGAISGIIGWLIIQKIVNIEV